jgi:hypothetical protein
MLLNLVRSVSFSKECGLPMKHASHPDIIKRLKRAHGHLASILAMFEDESKARSPKRSVSSFTTISNTASMRSTTRRPRFVN